jgi:hypothetical protein
MGPKRTPAATPAAKAAAKAATSAAMIAGTVDSPNPTEVAVEEVPGEGTDTEHGVAVPLEVASGQPTDQLEYTEDVAVDAMPLEVAPGQATQATSESGEMTPRRRLTARKQINSTGEVSPSLASWQVVDNFAEAPPVQSEPRRIRPSHPPPPPAHVRDAMMSPVRAVSEPERFNIDDQGSGLEEILGQLQQQPSDALFNMLQEQAMIIAQMREEMKTLRDERSAEAQWWAEDQDVGKDSWADQCPLEEENIPQVEQLTDPVCPRMFRPSAQGLAQSLGLGARLTDAFATPTSPNRAEVTLGDLAQVPVSTPSPSFERISDIKLSKLQYPNNPAQRAKVFNQWLTSLELEVQPTCASAVPYIEEVVLDLTNCIAEYNKRDEVARTTIMPDMVVKPQFVRIERALRPALLNAIPERTSNQLKQERRVSVVEILWELATTYLPGSNDERQQVHEKLSKPGGQATSATDAMQKLIDWQESDARAIQLNLTLPDSAILLSLAR